ASYRAWRSGFGSATFSGGGAGSPLNFCQSPVSLRILSTGSVGWAPTLSQYCTRSEFTSMREGFSLGWYSPISSIARPSRLVRASATTIRYCGLRIIPSRLSLILTATGVVSPASERGIGAAVSSSGARCKLAPPTGATGRPAGTRGLTMLQGHLLTHGRTGLSDHY